MASKPPTPSALAGHLSCAHLTQLERQRRAGTLQIEFPADPRLEALQHRGFRHEAEYVERLRAEGFGIHDLTETRDPSATIAAMRAGHDVIVQAPLANDIFFGVADVLLRCESFEFPTPHIRISPFCAQGDDMRLAGFVCLSLAFLAFAQEGLAQTPDLLACNNIATDPGERIAACTRAIDSAQDSPPQIGIAYFSRGTVRWRKGQLDLAIADYDRSISINPGHAASYTMRGVVLTDKEDYRRAIADFDEAIKLSPENGSNYLFRGIAWSRSDQLDRAMQDLSEAIRLDPKLSDAYGNRGIVWARKRDFDRAIGDLNEAIHLSPSAGNYYRRGRVWAEKNNLTHAIEDFTEAIRLNPRNADAYKGRSVMHERRGEHAEAVADSKEAARLDPAKYKP